MNDELLVNASPEEIRVARLENGLLVELWIERASRRGLVGNIYKGKVVRVLPGMEAAFIDIGLDRAAFLHVSDIAQPAVEAERPPTKSTNIHDHLREGDAVLVQVIKDPLGTKGARLTTHLTIPSRYLVHMPQDDTVGISSKIEDDTERERLRAILTDTTADDDVGMGFIVRTAAEGACEDALRRDKAFLQRLWASVQQRAASCKGVAAVYEDLPLMLRTLRDLPSGSIERIRIDSRETMQRARDFCAEFVPHLSACLEHYPGERPIFDLYGVEDEIKRALDRKVVLKSGGYLIIDQTESMTTVDVNTGAFVGHRNLEETIFKTNLEAAQAIARQLRLRNLGGIIIIDFIDMSEEEHKRQVMRAFDKVLERDYAKSQVCSVSSLGLVEMTRKRTRESLEHLLCEPCSTCQGRGTLKTAETVCYEISREIIRQVRQFDVASLTILASQDVVDLFSEEFSDYLAELEAFVEVPIRLQAETVYSQEQYDVVLV